MRRAAEEQLASGWQGWRSDLRRKKKGGCSGAFTRGIPRFCLWNLSGFLYVCIFFLILHFFCVCAHALRRDVIVDTTFHTYTYWIASLGSLTFRWELLESYRLYLRTLKCAGQAGSLRSRREQQHRRRVKCSTTQSHEHK